MCLELLIHVKKVEPLCPSFGPRSGLVFSETTLDNILHFCTHYMYHQVDTFNTISSHMVVRKKIIDYDV